MRLHPFCVLMTSALFLSTECSSGQTVSGACEYHPIPNGAIAMVLSIPANSRDLKNDGRGRYFEGNDTVRSYANIAYNFFTYWPETCEQPLPRMVRFTELHLDRPREGGRSLGIIKEQEFTVHLFTTGKPLLEMEVGSTVESPTTVLLFRSDNRVHFLRFGDVPPFQGSDPTLDSPGKETTKVRLTRETKTTWRIVTGENSVGRVSAFPTGARPKAHIDLGLFDFSFEAQLTLQRPFNDRLVDGKEVRQPVAK
jgi:hypothetical protein